MNIANVLFGALAIIGIICVINIGIKNSNAMKGICIKAHPYSSFSKGSSFSTGVRYLYKGKIYSGEVASNEKLFIRGEDSCFIKIDPSVPDHPVYSSGCK